MSPASQCSPWICRLPRLPSTFYGIGVESTWVAQPVSFRTFICSGTRDLPLAYRFLLIFSYYWATTSLSCCAALGVMAFRAFESMRVLLDFNYLRKQRMVHSYHSQNRAIQHQHLHYFWKEPQKHFFCANPYFRDFCHLILAVLPIDYEYCFPTLNKRCHSLKLFSWLI